LKVNYFGIVAAMFAVASLATSWFAVTMATDDHAVTADFTAYLYQIHGTATAPQPTPSPTSGSSTPSWR
jgi:hypothetical protein